MDKKPVLGIILGDAAGVGPEIITKLAAENFYDEYCYPVILGDARVFERGARVNGVSVKTQIISDIGEATWKDGIPILDQKDLDPEEVPFGQLSIASGRACLNLLKLGIELFQEGKIDGFCFGPLNKAGMIQAGCQFESEHHYMAHLLNHTAPFGEINVVDNMWTTRTTSHIPIAKVSESLTKEKILRAITLADTTLRNTGLKNPRLGIAALNPHCGENGKCGREEIEVIGPAVEEAQERGINATGPWSSDILFHKAFNGDFDGVVTMYHDQGQIALKLRGFERGITIAGGLPVPIATCGHGTAYDIAGKGIVKTTSFENAVKMTATMAAHVRSQK